MAWTLEWRDTQSAAWLGDARSIYTVARHKLASDSIVLLFFLFLLISFLNERHRAVVLSRSSFGGWPRLSRTVPAPALGHARHSIETPLYRTGEVCQRRSSEEMICDQVLLEASDVILSTGSVVST